MALSDMNEALNRGWGNRDCRVPMLLLQERAGVEISVERDCIAGVLEDDPPFTG